MRFDGSVHRVDHDRSPHRLLGLVGGAVVVGALAWALVHGARGFDLAAVTRLIGQVSPRRFAGLAALWAAGPAVYAICLAAAMPGLGWRRAVVLNLTGSTIANVVPAGGGAAGSALNLGMCRRWGHDTASFTAYFLLTNLLDVAAKLLLPLAAVLLAMATSADLTSGMGWLAALAAAGLLVMGAAVALAWRAADAPARSVRSPRLLGRLLGRLVDLLRGSTRLMGDRLRAGWPRLAVGGVGYVALQAVLLHGCLAAVGLQVPWAVAVMATGIERLGAIIPFTPSGAGFAEAGAVGWLVAAGQPAEQAVAAVLLYRLFVVGVSTAAGGVVLGGRILGRASINAANVE